ncbi:MAG: hypothetical protein NT051_05520 [Candidatus Micrarchaeota archaeon]|nr:hypothetical protein [Candidatus Micrarchaeota archaeon]
MLITTSKSPASASVALARALSSVLPCSKYIGRGKRSLSRIISLARGEGRERVCEVCQEQGKPSCISFIAVLPSSASRLSPKLQVSSFNFSGDKKAKPIGEVKISGANSRALTELLGEFPEADCEELPVKVTAGKSKLSFASRKAKLVIGV